MAFNPFHRFRKHQKAMFAGLTILCMFIFVLSGSMSAGWDYFVDVLHFFGATGSRMPEVGTLYGKDVEGRTLLRWDPGGPATVRFPDLASRGGPPRDSAHRGRRD